MSRSAQDGSGGNVAQKDYPRDMTRHSEVELESHTKMAPVLGVVHQHLNHGLLKDGFQTSGVRLLCHRGFWDEKYTMTPPQLRIPFTYLSSLFLVQGKTNTMGPAS